MSDIYESTETLYLVAEEPRAFPSKSPSGYHLGMTLRDYFAARAMGHLCGANWTTSNSELLAKMAYVLADAMLKERNKETKTEPTT